MTLFNFERKLLMNQIGSEAGGGGRSAQAPGTEAEAAAQASGEGYDDLGYPIAAATPPPPPPPPPAAQSTPPPPPPAAAQGEPPALPSVTGYGAEPPPAPPKPPEPPKAPEPDPELGFALKTDGIPDEEVKDLKVFLKTEGFTEKQANAFVARKQAEIKAANDAKVAAEQKEIEAQRTQRSAWHQELKTDPVFGGDKFSFNVQRAEKVVTDFMPNTKKILTERGTVLPPYVMRDLASIAETLFASPQLVQGSAVVPQEEEGPDDHLAFYK